MDNYHKYADHPVCKNHDCEEVLMAPDEIVSGECNKCMHGDPLDWMEEEGYR